jgi:hypothetical protein
VVADAHVLTYLCQRLTLSSAATRLMLESSLMVVGIRLLELPLDGAVFGER